MTEAWHFAVVDSFLTQTPDDQRGRLSAGRGNRGSWGAVGAEKGGFSVFLR